MKTTLFGTGNVVLRFGNCWKTGVVKVYLDGSEIETAGPGEFKVVSFEYNNGLELKISELNTAIIQIDKFVTEATHMSVITGSKKGSYAKDKFVLGKLMSLKSQKSSHLI